MTTTAAVPTACFGGTLSAVNKVYHVSNDGSDDADGLSPETAWKSVERLHNQWFDPGDTIKFRKGDTFRETFFMTTSGTVDQPIVLTSYGDGDKPLFTLPLLDGWEDLGNGVFRSPFNGSELSGVWEDHVPVMPRASDRTLTDGQWFANGSHLYYRPSSGHANNHEISAIDRIYSFNSGIWLSDLHYVTVSNLSFKGMPVGVYSRDFNQGTQGLQIRNCDFHYCQSAIFLLPDVNHNRNAIIDGNYFYRNHNGVRFFTTSALAPGPNVNGRHLNCQITNNEFDEEGSYDGKNRWDYGFTDYEAIGLQNFSGGLIADNYIHDGVSIGIIIYNFKGETSDNNVITRNRIIDNNRVSLFFTGEDNRGAADYSYSGNMISHNILAGEKESDNPGIWFDQGWGASSTNQFVHNVCVGKTQQIQITRAEIPSYLEVQNNIFYGQEYHIWIFQEQAPTELVLDYNLYHTDFSSGGWFVQKDTRDLAYIQNLGYERNGMIADPKFVSIEARDFHLQDDSPARNAGVIIPGLSIDFSGNPIGDQPDIGVYQHESQTTSTGSVEMPNLEIFPNPASDILNIVEVTPGTDYKISDLTGRTALVGRLSKNSISVSSLTPGLYLLCVGDHHSRFVKQ